MKEFDKDSNIIVNVSGRGDKDINTVAEIDGIKFWIDYLKDYLTSKKTIIKH